METKFKGTNGKWTLGVVPEYNDALKSAMLEIQSGSYWVCKVQNNGMIGSVEGKANALLISKSPEMLEMLEKLLIMYKQSDRPSIRLILETEQLIKEATEL